LGRSATENKTKQTNKQTNTTMVYVIQVLLTACEQDQGGYTYTVAVCTEKKNPDCGQRNCPKHVEFYSKNKFEN